MDVDARTDPLKEHDGQASPKVLPELLQPREDRVGPVKGIDVEFADVQREPSRDDEIEDSSPVCFRKQADQVSVGGIECEANGHRFAVPQLIARELLQLVRRPVSEVERTRGAELK